MPGPGVTIILRTPPEPGLLHQVLARLSAEGGDSKFWIHGHPFMLWVGEEYEGELAELQTTGVGAALGWEPQASIGVAAMCSGDADHVLLAKLCIQLAKAFDGVIECSARVSFGPILPYAEWQPPVRFTNPSGLTGTLFAASARDEDGSFDTRHFLDSSLLESWLRAPGFRLPK